MVTAEQFAAVLQTHPHIRIADAARAVENIVETSIGFYCSEECRDAAECGGETDFREDFHADG